MRRTAIAIGFSTVILVAQGSSPLHGQGASNPAQANPPGTVDVEADPLVRVWREEVSVLTRILADWAA